MSSAPFIKMEMLLEMKTLSLLGKEGMIVKSGQETKGDRWPGEWGGGSGLEGSGNSRTWGESAGSTGN